MCLGREDRAAIIHLHNPDLLRDLLDVAVLAFTREIRLFLNHVVAFRIEPQLGASAQAITSARADGRLRRRCRTRLAIRHKGQYQALQSVDAILHVVRRASGAIGAALSPAPWHGIVARANVTALGTVVARVAPIAF